MTLKFSTLCFPVPCSSVPFPTPNTIPSPFTTFDICLLSVPDKLEIPFAFVPRCHFTASSFIEFCAALQAC
ncbi:hypothetical protein C8Q77DRAFT_1107276 [Trametes polyzona]|nr:hypothetical protein C8Q77DRAFT_1107276 [Trametes polyzona]